ncbi:hypothetical protein CALVIDRAFT_536635 [Calocera viscosa TUFC12733]|uniref:Uncharacterized protein n=1 Tax=Calocera viscosa (strain TUFC12733) TaxID=1330018 RepID=A0A167MY58_CALVF|nr:hypothetical protein CALVIDRAFT_536635 [Calocera viscosa TUFC12733]
MASTQGQRVEFAPTPYYARGEGVDTHCRTARQKTIPFTISAHRNNPCSPHSSGLQHVKLHTLTFQPHSHDPAFFS